MEVRASYVSVGIFVVILTTAAFAALIWFGSLDDTQRYDRFRILFTGNVSGLSVGSAVRLRGVPVGSVKSIRINPQNIETVQVDVEIDASVPIKTDAVAQLEMAGITGGSFVQISGNSETAPTLTAGPSDTLPLIQSKASPLQELFRDAPELLREANIVMTRLEGFLGDDNQRAFNEILVSTATLISSISDRVGDIDSTIGKTSGIVDDLTKTVEEVNRTLTTLRQATEGIDAEVRSFGGSAQQAASQLDATLKSFQATATQVTGMVQENRGPIRDFISSGLYDFTMFINEARQLVSALLRVSTRVQRDPSELLFGN